MGRAAAALALTALPGCGDQRLRVLLAATDGDPERAWTAVRSGTVARLGADVLAGMGPRASDLLARWRVAAVAIDPASTARAMHEAGIAVWILGEPDYPVALVDDPDPPPLLFWRGRAEAVPTPGAAAVALIGTRRCTSYGADVARQLGRDLAAGGVTVVSGLALGIDGAAHEGALVAGATPPLAVVGSGLDIVYPPRHRSLWERVASAGVVLSEAPPGALPEGWRFPRRNRLLAALADVVVVVECHAAGGSLSTVREALDRDVPVMAVPGSVRSPSSVGTNKLLADGAAPVTEVDDILVALSLVGARPAPSTSSRPSADQTPDAPPAAALTPEERTVLEAVDWTPTATEVVLARVDLPMGATVTVLARLEDRGLVRRRGGWWERALHPKSRSPEITPREGYTSPD